MKFGINYARTAFNLELIISRHHLINNSFPIPHSSWTNPSMWPGKYFFFLMSLSKLLIGPKSKKKSKRSFGSTKIGLFCGTEIFKTRIVSKLGRRWGGVDTGKGTTGQIAVCSLRSVSFIFLRPASTYCLVQPMPLGVTFSNAVSKLKPQTSNVSFTTFQWKETFKLWALSFVRAFEIVTSNGPGDWLYYVFRVWAGSIQCHPSQPWWLLGWIRPERINLGPWHILQLR